MHWKRSALFVAGGAVLLLVTALAWRGYFNPSLLIGWLPFCN